jgi:hypothetical protein
LVSLFQFSFNRPQFFGTFDTSHFSRAIHANPLLICRLVTDFSPAHWVVEISWSCTDAPFDIVGLYSIERTGVFSKTTFAPLLYQSEIGVILGGLGTSVETNIVVGTVFCDRTVPTSA